MIIWALFLLLMIYSFCCYFAPCWHYANWGSFSNKCMSSFNLWCSSKFFFPFLKLCLLVYVFVNVFMVLILLFCLCIHPCMHVLVCVCVSTKLWEFWINCESLNQLVNYWKLWSFELLRSHKGKRLFKSFLSEKHVDVPLFYSPIFDICIFLFVCFPFTTPVKTHFIFYWLMN